MAPFTVRAAASSATTYQSTGTTMSAETVIGATSEVTGEGRGEAIATVTSEVAGTRGNEADMIMLRVEGVATAASDGIAGADGAAAAYDEIAGADGAADWDAPAEQVEAQFEPTWEGVLLPDWLGGL